MFYENHMNTYDVSSVRNLLVRLSKCLGKSMSYLPGIHAYTGLDLVIHVSLSEVLLLLTVVRRIIICDVCVQCS